MSCERNGTFITLSQRLWIYNTTNIFVCLFDDSLSKSQSKLTSFKTESSKMYTTAAKINTCFMGEMVLCINQKPLLAIARCSCYPPWTSDGRFFFFFGSLGSTIIFIRSLTFPEKEREIDFS